MIGKKKIKKKKTGPIAENEAATVGRSRFWVVSAPFGVNGRNPIGFCVLYIFALCSDGGYACETILNSIRCCNTIIMRCGGNCKERLRARFYCHLIRTSVTAAVEAEYKMIYGFRSGVYAKAVVNRLSTRFVFNFVPTDFTITFRAYHIIITTRFPLPIRRFVLV